MTDNQEDYGTLSLYYRDGFNENTFSAEFKLNEDDIFWDSLLQKFVNFLEAAGYHVKDKIAIADSLGVDGRWEGRTFTDE